MDGEAIADIESSGVDGWLGELARDLKEGTYRPNAVRQVLIPKKQRGKFRPLGIPCVRDRVAQTAAMLVLSPIFEADLAPEQYAYRPGRSAGDAVKHVHRLLNRGHREVVDADLTDYFGQIPHAELIKSVARRISDGRVVGWIKAWLEMAVEEEDGCGGRRRTTRARQERKGTPQGAPISPLLSNLYMRRFILGWKGLGYARRFKAEIVNYADDFVVLGQAPAAIMRTAVEDLVKRLKLALNAEKTREVRVPEEPLEFLGYRIDGRNYLPGYGASLHWDAPEPGERSEPLPQGERVDRETLWCGCRRNRWTPGTRASRGTPQPASERLGELLLVGSGESRLCDDRSARDPAAAPVAEPQAQGEGREDGALPGQATLEGVGAHSSWSANGQLSVGARMISSESRMR